MFKVGTRVAAISFGLSISPIQAQVLTSVIVDACLSDDAASNQMCQAFIRGAVDGMQWAADVAAYQSGATEAQEMRNLSHTLLRACIPPGANGDQYYAISLKYMQDHPESWHKPAVVVIHQAVMEAFPCAG